MVGADTLRECVAAPSRALATRALCATPQLTFKLAGRYRARFSQAHRGRRVQARGTHGTHWGHTAHTPVQSVQSPTRACCAPTCARHSNRRERRCRPMRQAVQARDAPAGQRQENQAAAASGVAAAAVAAAPPMPAAPAAAASNLNPTCRYVTYGRASSPSCRPCDHATATPLDQPPTAPPIHNQTQLRRGAAAAPTPTRWLLHSCDNRCAVC
jgi:hypothetical protein